MDLTPKREMIVAQSATGPTVKRPGDRAECRQGWPLVAVDESCALLGVGITPIYVSHSAIPQQVVVSNVDELHQEAHRPLAGRALRVVRRLNQIRIATG